MPKKVALLVEGDGDITAFPVLLRMCLTELGCDGEVTCMPPIKVGDPVRAIKGGRFLKLFTYAIGVSTNDAVLVCLDCDDFCPLEASNEIYDRVAEIAASFQKPVGICLFDREYESMFLANIDDLAMIRSEINLENFREQDWPKHREAKGQFSKMLGNLSYKETRDQVRYTSVLNVNKARSKYRPLAHFLNVLERFPRSLSRCGGVSVEP